MDNTPSPDITQVNAWLAQLSRRELHDNKWPTVNHRHHGITMGARTFAQEHYPGAAEREGFFDGLTAVLWLMGRAADQAAVEAMLSPMLDKKSIKPIIQTSKT